VLVDEVYLEAMFEAAPRSCVHLGPQFISTSSLTKGYGLSGLRCGWILCEPDSGPAPATAARCIWRRGTASGGNTERAGLKRLPKFIDRAKAILETNRAALRDFLDSREELKAVRNGSRHHLVSNVVEKEMLTIFGPPFMKSTTRHSCPATSSNRRSICGSACVPSPNFFSEGVKRLGAALDELG
jgi:aspartate/methionine/tyrosine aminotransferase